MHALLTPSPALAPSLLHPPPPLPAARTLFPQLPRAPRGGGGARCQFSDDEEEEAYLSELEASLRRASSSSSPRRRIPTGISSASAILSVTSLVVGATLGTFVAPGAGTAIGAAAGAFVVPAGALTGFARDPDGRGRPPIHPSWSTFWTKNIISHKTLTCFQQRADKTIINRPLHKYDYLSHLETTNRR